MHISIVQRNGSLGLKSEIQGAVIRVRRVPRVSPPANSPETFEKNYLIAETRT